MYVPRYGITTVGNNAHERIILSPPTSPAESPSRLLHLLTFSVIITCHLYLPNDKTLGTIWPCLYGSGTCWIFPTLKRFPLRTEPGRCSRTREAPPSTGPVSASRLARERIPKRKYHHHLSVNNHNILSRNSNKPFQSSCLGTRIEAIRHISPPSALDYRPLLRIHRRRLDHKH